jgi:hypothetical protein
MYNRKEKKGSMTDKREKTDKDKDKVGFEKLPNNRDYEIIQETLNTEIPKKVLSKSSLYLSKGQRDQPSEK